MQQGEQKSEKFKCHELAQDIEDLQRQYPGSEVEEPFRRGYERGRAHFETTRARGTSTANLR
jgi:hypothetical protein